jgi:agmatinase
MAHVVSSGVFPVVLGGDHSIGYPTIRGLAPYTDGNVGIIHFDRHVDTQELDLDERMHTTPWFHATDIKNAPPQNLVQIGIGGWQAPRAGVKVGRGRGTTVMTVGDVERVGIEKIAETALELAWQGAKAVYLSFDIDVIDSGFVPGTGWPEPGGLLPREALGLVRLVAEGGISGMEVVECSPPYDWAEQTSLLSARVVLDALATMVSVGHLGKKAATKRTAAWGPYPEAVAGPEPRRRPRPKAYAGGPANRRRRPPGRAPRPRSPGRCEPRSRWPGGRGEAHRRSGRAR